MLWVYFKMFGTRTSQMEGSSYKNVEGFLMQKRAYKRGCREVHAGGGARVGVGVSPSSMSPGYHFDKVNATISLTQLTAKHISVAVVLCNPRLLPEITHQNSFFTATT